MHWNTGRMMGLPAALPVGGGGKEGTALAHCALRPARSTAPPCVVLRAGGAGLLLAVNQGPGQVDLDSRSPGPQRC